MNRVNFPAVIILAFLFFTFSVITGWATWKPAATDWDIKWKGEDLRLCFKIRSPMAVKYELEIGENMPNNNGVISSPIPLYCGPAKQKNEVWETKSPKVKPNTLYYFVLRANLGTGPPDWRAGAAWTEERHVEITFSKIYMHDDGDDLDGGEPEFKVFNHANGKQLFKYGSVKDKDWFPTGESKYPNLSNIIKNVGLGDISLRIFAREWDELSIFDPKNLDPNAEYWDTAQAVHKQATYQSGKDVTTFSVRATSTRELDFTAYFKLEPYYRRRQDISVPDLSHLKPSRTSRFVKGTKSEAIDARPGKPMILEPVNGKYYCDVPIKVQSVSHPTNPIKKLELKFARYDPSCGNKNHPGCWKKIIIPFWETIDGAAINRTIPRSKFPKMGFWAMRVRSQTHTGGYSDWTEWRKFRIKDKKECN